MNEFLPAAYDKSILYAFRALFEGNANEGQQIKAMEWLVFNACHIGDVAMHADSRVHAFLEGQRSIGVQVAKLRQPEALAKITPATPRKSKRGKPEAP